MGWNPDHVRRARAARSFAELACARQDRIYQHPGWAWRSSRYLGRSWPGGFTANRSPARGIELVRFLIHAETSANQQDAASLPSRVGSNFYELPSLAERQDEATKRQIGAVVRRPSSETGLLYEQVTRAYIDAVHSVLLGKQAAPDAAAELEQDLIRITGV